MNFTVENVNVSFRKERQKSVFGRERQQALKNISLTINQGESLALVGESGSGKSTLGRVLSGLLKPDSGQATMDGHDIYSGRSRSSSLRNQISIVFQDYTTSVNPRFRVGDIIGESLRVLSKSGQAENKSVQSQVASLLDQVGLSASYALRYPHELSGGQLQRVCIARAVAVKPKLIVLDEAISSLDASTQTQVMDLLQELRRLHGFSYFFITHDLTAVTYMCDRIIFLHCGHITESVDRIEDLPWVQDEYARSLLAAVIKIDIEKTG
ncbi:MAG: dipeptide/oligopeptide/nickel ABC transporter ATP-binding protein [Deltaproteobacteria bacterium]|jgi:nickel transport system ATP-binding protein|nr:dipeptide/oligopeptide/nickel ABC transporter ATP-binding protein [Deltaproteobacteria bacterium]